MINPLKQYRQAQIDARKAFDAFTKVHCSTCPTPCCVYPARILPTDIMLAEAHGWRSKVESAIGGDAVQSSATTAIDALTGDIETQIRVACPHLESQGCSFPRDLRPFGCTTYICPIMYERLDKKSLSRLKRLVKQLGEAHRLLMAALYKH